MLTELTTADEMQPVPVTERIFALDVLRGFAILGVLVAYTLWSFGGPSSEAYGTADTVIEFVLGIMVDSKAYTLLAFLFGLGFAIQMTRADSRGENVIPLYCRRLLALAVIGVAHALLLRDGDILVPYATMGFVLLIFRNASNRTLLIGVVIGAVFQYAAHALWEFSGVPFPPRPNTVVMGHLASNIEWTTYWYTTAITHWPGALPMFLAGLYVGKRRLLDIPAGHRRGLLQILIAGLCVGAAAYYGRSLMIGMMNYHPNGGSLADISIKLLWAVHAWGVAAFYAAAVLLLLKGPGFRKFSAPFAAVGRMSLTNYLLQSILIVPICIVFDLFDKVTP